VILVAVCKHDRLDVSHSSLAEQRDCVLILAGSDMGCGIGRHVKGMLGGLLQDQHVMQFNI